MAVSHFCLNVYVVGDSKETALSNNSLMYKHELTETVTASPDMFKFKPHKIPEGEGKVDTTPPTLVQLIPPEKGNSIFQ